MTAPSICEQVAVEQLAGVGGDIEWWIYRNNVGHLRVPITAAEASLIPPGLAEHDAGKTGPQRPRTIKETHQ